MAYGLTGGMIPLLECSNHFEARIMGARLGAAGIVWEIRGHSDPYPFGPVVLCVELARADDARELLIHDRPQPRSSPVPTALSWWLLAALVTVAAGLWALDLL